MRILSLSALAVATLAAAACASNPPPEPPAPKPTEVAVTPPPVVPPVQPTQPTKPTPTGPAAGSRADFAAKVGDAQRVYFDYDKYNLDTTDQQALASQVAWLKQFPSTRVEIQGNADERGTRDYNIALGARRAESVKSYLMSQGIADSRIQTISFGKDKPVDMGHDEAAWGKNRNAFTNVIVEAIS